jgi:ankyrin repeat protein
MRFFIFILIFLSIHVRMFSQQQGPEYIADSAGAAGPDTSYFLAGDPEFNLIRAVEFGQLEVVKILIDRGIDADASTFEGVTPLMFASQNGDIEIIQYLLSQGADVNATPNNGVTALIGAVRTEQYEAAEMLLDSGASVDARDELDLTSLMHASAYNYPEIVELLIDHGAGLEKRDWFGSTPLMMAAYYNCIESADILLERGADPDGKDKNGFTPLMIAAQHGDYDMAWLLLDMGADPEIRNIGGLHAMGIAVMQKDQDLVELLLESGADINQNINASTNALSLAEESGNEALGAFLKSNGARQNRRPEISEIRGGLILNFNGDDFMLGFEAGVTENKYKTYITSGFLARPAAIRILRPGNDSLSFQLWEKRFLWPISLGKDFMITGDSRQILGFRIHLTGALTWGSYRGSSLNPGPAYLLMPGAGVFWREKNFGILFDYQYVPLNVHDISNHRFMFSILGYFDFRSRIKYTRKDISWF